MRVKKRLQKLFQSQQIVNLLMVFAADSVFRLQL